MTRKVGQGSSVQDLVGEDKIIFLTSSVETLWKSEKAGMSLCEVTRGDKLGKPERILRIFSMKKDENLFVMVLMMSNDVKKVSKMSKNGAYSVKWCQKASLTSCLTSKNGAYVVILWFFTFQIEIMIKMNKFFN